jgi:hypothetical protein
MIIPHARRHVVKALSMVGTYYPWLRSPFHVCKAAFIYMYPSILVYLWVVDTFLARPRAQYFSVAHLN